jgi:uncharacterized SAM-binding protein YcdF (DUF218 family)
VHNDYRKPICVIDGADAILVLSGMLEINEVRNSTNIDWEDTDRFLGGIAFFKAGKAQKPIFIGGKMPWNKAKKTEGVVLKEHVISNGMASEKIFVTKDVENTAEEAVAEKELINPSKRIILVTSAYHLYRAKNLFEKQGFIVTAKKVNHKATRNDTTTLMDFLPNAATLELTETRIREVIGGLFYLVKVSDSHPY